mgnify:CR=1 FL=1
MWASASHIRTFLTAIMISGLLALVPTKQADAQSCGCSICGCFRNHPTSGEWNVPATEPCDCWVCLS